MIFLITPGGFATLTMSRIGLVILSRSLSISGDRQDRCGCVMTRGGSSALLVSSGWTSLVSTTTARVWMVCIGAARGVVVPRLRWLDTECLFPKMFGVQSVRRI